MRPSRGIRFTPMPRSYRQRCALALALDQLGDRWTLLLVRELLLGPRRFGELQSHLTAMGSNLLAARLKQLVVHGLVARVRVDDGECYALSQRGEALRPTILELIRWGLPLLSSAPKHYFSTPDWNALPLEASFVGNAADNLRINLVLDHLPLAVNVSAGTPSVTRGQLDDATTTAIASTSTMIALDQGMMARAEARRTGLLEIHGTVREFDRFLRLFSLSRAADKERLSQERAMPSAARHV